MTELRDDVITKMFFWVSRVTTYWYTKYGTHASLFYDDDDLFTLITNTIASPLVQMSPNRRIHIFYIIVVDLIDNFTVENC